MTGTIFLGGTARRKSSGARSQVCRNVSGPTRPVVSQSLGGHLATSQGYGVGAGLQDQFFVVLKNLLVGQAKGWETAETAAAEAGAWREAGTGYPPSPPHCS